MTQRLYYDNAYLTVFDACVTRVSPCGDGESVVYLDQSAFYPTSGGQPYDTGTLGGHKILDVYVDDDGDVAHRIEGELKEGACVRGEIDWPRRFDHMQQHAGEHILAGCVYRRLGGHTIGLHLGSEVSTIDVELPDGSTHLSDEVIELLENEVNACIQADAHIKCWFPDEAELNSLPLRKPPAVKEHIRIVQIGSEEFCACGGTHPSTAGQIGLFKLTDVRPDRGKIRFSFVCGGRANRLFLLQSRTLAALTGTLSADTEHLPRAAEELVKRLKDTEYRLNRALTENALNEVKSLTPDENGIVKHVFNGISADALKEAAGFIIAGPGLIALLASRTGTGVNLLFARSADLKADMGALMAGSVKLFGGKGGGKGDFARGSVPNEAALDEAARLLKAEGTGT